VVKDVGREGAVAEESSAHHERLRQQAACCSKPRCGSAGCLKFYATFLKRGFLRPGIRLIPDLRGIKAVVPILVLACVLGVVLLSASPLHAQEISLSLGEDDSLSLRTIQLILLITVLSLAPGLAIMITCFPFIVTVLSIVRQGIGLQQAPPNMLIVSLALFLTYFVMEPVFTEAWQLGIEPLLAGSADVETAIPLALDPFRTFMAARMDPDTFTALAALRPDQEQIMAAPDAPLSVLVPSFLLSEIARAFEIGFLVFLPFLIIDLVVAAILMSMGMMMVPPVVVSLPFKLAFFVVADGWTLIADSLVRGYF
jgi:flagellar biosynthetic protein FliP